MNLLKEKLNPNSEYNKKLRRDGITLITESYKKVIDLLDNLKGMIDDSQGNDYDYAFRTAIEALEKQIPKEVSTMEYRNDYDWTCNSCDTTFKYIRYTADKPMYCPNCGQAIKWE